MSVASAVPASAAGSVRVTIVDPVAGEAALWTISFTVEAALTAADDYIDIYLPPGMDLTGIVAHFGMSTTPGATGRALAIAQAAAPTVIVPTLITTRQARFDVPVNVPAGAWVAIQFVDLVNPTSCFRTVTIVQSNCCTTVSPEFAIYTVKMTLYPGAFGTGFTGMNLVSLPSYPVDEAIEVVLADLYWFAAFTAAWVTPFQFSVWYWDAAAEEWLVTASDTSFSQITTIEPGKAYWIKVNYEIDFYIKGDPYPVMQGPPVMFCWYVEGWNMVGFVSQAEMSADDYLVYTNLGYPSYAQAVAVVYTYDAINNAWVVVDMTANVPGDLSQGLELGQGYFMAFLDAACIIPPVP